MPNHKLKVGFFSAQKMGNIIEILKDPYLVRRVQEKFGARQIPVEVSDESLDAVSGQSFASSSNSSDEEDRDDKYDSSSSSLQESLKWLSSKTRVRRRVRTPPPHSDVVASEAATSLQSSHREKSEVLVVETNSFYDTYFRLATEVGYEPFYITFLPIIWWNVDTVLGRHAVIVWALSMYIGQGAKQIFKITRPAAPPAIRLEDNPSLETEYGFPSTHATVGTAIPFSLLYSCSGRYVFSLWVGLLLALFWCFSVSCSRIYLGVHSVLDIVGGCLIALAIFPTFMFLVTVTEKWCFIYEHPLTGPVLILLVIFLLYIYPANNKHWSRDRGDTGAILGASMGVLLGQCAMGHFPDDLDPGPFEPSFPSIHTLSLCVVRFVVGLLLLLPTRFVMKLLCYKLLPMVMPTHGVKEVVKRPLVELPYKIITYGAIGFNATYLNMIVFEICGISRWDQSLLS